MFRKDEKGYAMSGFGFLLLIPVLIAIPLALSVQDQSANLPGTFVKSDSVFQTYKSIQVDVNDKVNNFKNTVFGVTFNSPDQLGGNISALYDNTAEKVYKDTYIGVVDSLDIAPAKSNSLKISNISGTIPLKNGIEVDYNYVNRTNDTYKLYVYDMTVTVNMTMNIVKNNTGSTQGFTTVYGPFEFYLNSSTIPTNFFNDLSTGSNYNLNNKVIH